MLANPFALKVEYNLRLILSLAVVGCVVFASGYLAPRMSLERALLVAAVGLVVAGLTLVLRWPSLGLIGLVVAGLVAPFQIGTGTESSINAAILGVVGIFGLWIVDMLVRPEGRLRASRALPPLFALALTATLAFAFGNQPDLPFAEVAPMRAQLGGLAIFWLSPVALIVTACQIRDSRWLAGLTWVYIALGGSYIVARVIHFGLITDKLFQPGVTNGSLFYVWLVALCFGQAAFNRALAWPLRGLCSAIIAGTLYIGFFQTRDWNSGWVPPLVAIFVALCIARPRLGIPLTVVCLAGLALNASSVSSLLLNDYKQYDILTRSAAWTTLIPLISVNPILGLGPANYYWYTPLFTILGWNVRFNSHEQYMDLVLQTGFLGLLCFGWAMAEIAALGVRLRNRVAPGFQQSYVYAALGGLAGTLVAGLLGDWFLPFVYNIGFTGFRASVLGWIFLGGLLVLERQLRTSAPSAGTSLNRRGA